MPGTWAAGTSPWMTPPYRRPARPWPYRRRTPTWTARTRTYSVADARFAVAGGALAIKPRPGPAAGLLQRHHRLRRRLRHGQLQGGGDNRGPGAGRPPHRGGRAHRQPYRPGCPSQPRPDRPGRSRPDGQRGPDSHPDRDGLRRRRRHPDLPVDLRAARPVHLRQRHALRIVHRPAGRLQHHHHLYADRLRWRQRGRHRPGPGDRHRCPTPRFPAGRPAEPTGDLLHHHHHPDLGFRQRRLDHRVQDILQDALHPDRALSTGR